MLLGARGSIHPSVFGFTSRHRVPVFRTVRIGHHYHYHYVCFPLNRNMNQTGDQ